MEKTKSGHLWGFFILTFAASWAVWGATILFDLPDVPNGILILLGAFMPSIVGIILTMKKKDKGVKRDFWNRVVSLKRIGVKWLLFIFGFYAINWIITFIVYGIIEGSLPVFTNAVEILTNPLTLLGFTIIQILGGPLAEELGWRGYALDILQKKWNALNSSLILGFFWAIWHFPLFFVKNTSQISMGFGSTLFWLWVIGIFASSIMITWVYNNTNRSILGAVIIHLLGNYISTLLGGDIPVDKMVFGNAIFTAVSVILVFGIVIYYGPKNLSQISKKTI